MNKEEKEAIEKLTIKAITSSAEAPNFPNLIVMKKDLQILLNYIDKLQKENKELKEEIEELKRKTYKAYINDKGEIQFVFDNYISKDKIRTEIKELEEILEKRKTIDVIEEINRLEELLEDDE